MLDSDDNYSIIVSTYSMDGVPNNNSHINFAYSIGLDSVKEMKLNEIRKINNA